MFDNPRLISGVSDSPRESSAVGAFTGIVGLLETTSIAIYLEYGAKLGSSKNEED
jgi:hypothetical protein